MHLFKLALVYFINTWLIVIIYVLIFFQSLRVYYLKNSSRTTIWACDFEKEYGKAIHLWL
jgi:hypothetical protein